MGLFVCFFLVFFGGVGFVFFVVVVGVCFCFLGVVFLHMSDTIDKNVLSALLNKIFKRNIKTCIR